MDFKTPALEVEFRSAHPELRAVTEDLDAQLKRWGLRPLTITDVLRRPSFYGSMPRWSWHFCNCAADVRTRHYSQEELGRILAFLAGRKCRSSPRVDVVDETKTPQPHLHLEVEDWEWRRRYEQRTGRNTGAIT